MNPPRFARLRAALTRRQPDLTVVTERMQKPHNFSAILRTADAVGILEAHTVRPSGKVRIGCSISGGVKKFVQAKAHPQLEALLDEMKERRFALIAAHPSERAVDYREVDFTRPTAVVLGTERFGVSEATLAQADQLVTIPMEGLGQSLNVSVAAALILYEARHQRAKAGMYETSRLSPEAFTRTLFEWAYPKIAAECAARGEPYPTLDDDGEMLEPPSWLRETVAE